MACSNKEKSLAFGTFSGSHLIQGSRSLAVFLVIVLLVGVPLHRSFSFYATVFVTNTNDSGAGSLRQAILDANAAPGTIIAFNIPTSDANFNPITGAFTIRPTSALPSITANGTVLDGTTQTASTGDTNTAGPEIVLDGGAAGASVDGLTITASNCVVKGLTIQGFTRDGIRISGATATGNRVQGCYIGTNYAGTAAAANGGNGVYMLGGATNNTIGGTTTAERNVISGNGGSGVRIEGTGTINNIVQGNDIGTNAAGTAGIPNGSQGVNVLVGPNTIGAPGVGNRIAFNNSAGVSVIGGTTSGVTIRGNAIFSNNGLGIDLGINGVTTNDVRDLDVGPNGFQNFPVLDQVLTSGGNTVIRGTFNSLPNTTFALDFYSSAAKDPSNFGEGETYIGSANVATDPFGDATINVTLAGDLTGRFVTATATNLTTGDTSEFSAAQQATPAPAISLAFSVQPSNTAAGNIITPAVAVSLLDEFGNVVTSATNAVTLAIGANPGGGVLSGTATKSAVSGTATFNDLSINRTGNNYTLIASSVGFASVTSAAFNITPGPPAQLAFIVPPSNTQASAAITPAVQVAVQDSLGNLVNTATNSVTVAIGTNPSGGVLSGTLTVNAVNGIATFSNLAIDRVGVGYTLTASAAGLTGATSPLFNITATRLVFTTQPTTTAAGSAITPAVQVAAQDAFGNTDTTFTGNITVAIGTNPGGGVLSGTTTRSAVNGVATFNNLSIDKVGTGYTLTATATGLVNGVSAAFNITPGAATQLVFAVQPSNGTVRQTLTPAIQVAAQDALGNTDTNFAGSITVAIGTNPGGGVLSGTTTRSAVNGVATFNDLSIDQVGNGYTLIASSVGFASVTSAAFNITPGPPAQLAFIVPPSNTKASAAITPAVQVAVQDSFGNLVNTATNSVTVAIGTNPSGGVLSGTLTVNAVNGIATFSNLAIDRVGVGYTLTASAAGLTGATSPSFNITATRLIFTVQPTNTVAGSAITPAVQVAAQDNSGNTDTTFTGSITVAIGTNPGGGTLSGTTTANAVNGVATFSNLSIDKAGTGYTLTATATGLVNGTSAAFNITPGAATRLVFTVQPGNGTVGVTLIPAIQVVAQDNFGNTDTTFTGNITVAIGTNPGGGTLSGTTTRSAVNGVATFNDLSIDQVGNGYTLVASSGTLTSATSNPFNIVPPLLAFIVQPSNATAGAAISPAVKVAVQDVLGNTITTATNSITVAIGMNPGGGTLSGTTTVNAVNGIATFSDLTIDKIGNGYTLIASSAGLTSATSAAFNITPGPPAQLAFIVPPSNTKANAAIAPAVQVAVQDSRGNLVNTATNSVTVAIGANPSGGTLSGTTTLNAINGVATFPDLSINRVGVGYTLIASAAGLTGATSPPFNITATRLVFTTQPTTTAAGSAITPAVQVAAQDAFGNTDTTFTGSITVAIGTNPGGGTLSGTTTVNAVNGVATFNNLSIDKVGNGYTLTATNTGLTSATSAAFNITPGAATQLVFAVQPSNGTVGVTLTPAIQVVAQDAFGNTDTTFTGNITVAIGTNPSGGTLSGTTTRSAVNGVATFNDLSVDRAGNGYTLVASSGALTSATSNPFDIAPLRLAFIVQPSNTTAGAAISPAVKVAVQDALGNTVTTATHSITVAIGTNPSGGTLSGTTTVNAVNGVATFSNLSIEKAGNGYTLRATSPNLTDATSAAFNILPASPSKLVFAQQPTNTTAGKFITPAVKVAVQDRFDNVTSNVVNSITLDLGVNPGGASLGGIKVVNTVNGIATFNDLSLDKVGTGYRLRASTSGLSDTLSDPFDVTVGNASVVVFTQQPADVAGGNPILPAVQVTIQDPFGNPITSATNAVTLSLGNNPSGGILYGTTTVNAVNGVATFDNLRIDKAGNGYTLHATVSGLGETNSNPFDVVSNEATLPTLTNPQVNPTNLTKDGGTVTLSVEATDNVQVQSVWAEVTKPDGSKQTVNLTLQSGNTYTGTFNAPANLDVTPQTYSVLFFAKDNAGNTAATTTALQFIVAAGPDAINPTLTNPRVTPNNLSESGGAVTLSVNVTDNVGVTSVWAEVTKPDNTKERVNLTLQSGVTYTGTFNAPVNSTCDPQTYKVVFFARDDAGNQGGPTTELQFTVAENTTPFSLASATLNVTNLPNTGGAVLITANLTGCQGVVNLVATVTTGKGRKSTTVATILLTKQTETVYTGTFNAPANNTKKDITYKITVSLNNGTPITAGTVTVAKKGRKPQGVLDNDEEDTLKIGAGSPLRLRLLSAHNGSAATVFTFTLNKAAAVTARILSPTGKAVRQLGLRQATTGLNSLVWDGKAQTGGSVARGVYLIEILAQDETGQVARAAQTVVVK